jgi:type I restriction enzyme S subunit
MAVVENLITDHLDIWASAVKSKSSAGRGSRGKTELYGVKKLRELILELAVRGLLVPQDPEDEPASVLLEKIGIEKKRQIGIKALKKQPVLPPISLEEEPFDLPKGWRWTRLGDVTNYGVADKATREDVEAETWVLELEDVEKLTSNLLQRVRAKDRNFKSAKSIFSQGDVIYGKLRPYLDKVIVADEDGVCTTEMIPVKAFSEIAPKFLRLIMKSPYFVDYANRSTHGMNLPRMGTEKARLALLPIVGLGTQHRIVTKVDELMSLCDALEQQQESSITAHKTLVETLLAALTNAADKGEFDQAWTRIAEHFDTLFTTEHSIDQLKQTILQLAVMGKLVPQNPNDEPASELLKKIAAEKAQLIKDKKIKPQKPLPPIGEDEKPFVLPVGWEWVRFQQVAHSRLGKMLDRAKNKGIERPYLRNTNVQWHKFALDDVKVMNIEDSEVEELRINRGDLLICEGGEPGRGAIWDDEISEVYFQKALHRARCYRGVLAEYILLCLTVDATSGALGKYFTGATIKHFSGDKLKRYTLPLPPAKYQSLLMEKVTRLLIVCDEIKASLGRSRACVLNIADLVSDDYSSA